MPEKWWIIVHPKAFSPIKQPLQMEFAHEADAKYLCDVLERAGEQVDLFQEQVKVTLVFTSPQRARSRNGQ